MSPEERRAHAVQEVAAFRGRVARNIAESREEFLQEHEDLRDLLEIILADSPARRESWNLPNDLERKLVEVHARTTMARAGKIAELCREHRAHEDEIRRFLESLERTESRVLSAVQFGKVRSRRLPIEVEQDG